MSNSTKLQLSTDVPCVTSDVIKLVYFKNGRMQVQIGDTTHEVDTDKAEAVLSLGLRLTAAGIAATKRVHPTAFSEISPQPVRPVAAQPEAKKAKAARCLIRKRKKIKRPLTAAGKACTKKYTVSGLRSTVAKANCNWHKAVPIPAEATKLVPFQLEPSSPQLRSRSGQPIPGHRYDPDYVCAFKGTEEELRKKCGRELVRWDEVEGYHPIPGQFGRFEINEAGELLSDITPGIPRGYATRVPLRQSLAFGGLPYYVLSYRMAVPQCFLVLQTIYPERPRPSLAHYATCLDGNFENLSPENLAWTSERADRAGRQHVAHNEKHSMLAVMERKRLRRQTPRQRGRECVKLGFSGRTENGKVESGCGRVPIMQIKKNGKRTGVQIPIHTYSHLLHTGGLNTAKSFCWDAEAYEAFRPCKGLEGEGIEYCASKDGMIVSSGIGRSQPGCATILRGDALRASVRNIYISGMKNPKFHRHHMSIGEMVLRAWGPEKPEHCNFVRYKDGDYLNTHIDNLEWSSHNCIKHKKKGRKRVAVMPNENLADHIKRIYLQHTLENKSVAAIAKQEGATEQTIRGLINLYSSEEIDSDNGAGDPADPGDALDRLLVGSNADLAS